MRAMGLALFLASLAGVASAYESPEYTIIETLEGFEVREYAPYVVVETPVALKGASGSRNTAFRRLFGYISGNNLARREMAMTTPVVQAEQQGESIAMTSPVSESVQEDGTVWMQFVLPLSMTFEEAPQPLDPSVRIRQVDVERVAALRYSGSSGQRRFERMRQQMMESLADSQWRAEGTPRSAVYNGPFTPGFMRRNEVLVPVTR